MKFVLKKYLLLILSFGSIAAMEKRHQNDALALTGKKQKIDLSEICWFDTVPNEIILPIVEHVINDSPRLIVVFQRLAKLALINKNFRDLVSSEYMRKYIEKRFKSKIAFDEGTLQAAFNYDNDDLIKSIMRIKGMNLGRAEYRFGKNVVTPLLWIAQKDDCEFLKELAIHSKENNIFADMYNWDEAGNTALVYAKEKNDSEMIQLLENNKPTTEYGSYWRAYPKYDDFKRSSGVRTGYRCKQYMPLIEAVISNNLKRAKELKRGINFAFILACQIGNSSMVSCLLERINDVNSITLHGTADQDEVTPLYIAIKYGHFNVVKLLLDKNATIREKDMQLACAHGYADIVKLLTEKQMFLGKSSEIWLNVAIHNGHLDVVKLLIPKMIEVDYRISLMLAINEGHFDIVKYLSESCGNWDNDFLDGALKLAHEMNHKKIVEYLEFIKSEIKRHAINSAVMVCKICEEAVTQSEATKLACNHIFHKDCLAWLSNECPVCKK